jgi:hypothetical protein
MLGHKQRNDKLNLICFMCHLANIVAFNIANSGVTTKLLTAFLVEWELSSSDLIFICYCMHIIFR